MTDELPKITGLDGLTGSQENDVRTLAAGHVAGHYVLPPPIVDGIRAAALLKGHEDEIGTRHRKALDGRGDVEYRAVVAAVEAARRGDIADPYPVVSADRSATAKLELELELAKRAAREASNRLVTTIGAEAAETWTGLEAARTATLAAARRHAERLDGFAGLDDPIAVSQLSAASRASLAALGPLGMRLDAINAAVAALGRLTGSWAALAPFLDGSGLVHDRASGGYLFRPEGQPVRRIIAVALAVEPVEVAS